LRAAESATVASNDYIATSITDCLVNIYDGAIVLVLIASPVLIALLVLITLLVYNVHIRLLAVVLMIYRYNYNTCHTVLL
jgi:hypothetical protein